MIRGLYTERGVHMRFIEAVFRFIAFVFVAKILFALIPVVLIAIGLYFVANVLFAGLFGIGLISFPVCLIAAIVIRIARKASK